MCKKRVRGIFHMSTPVNTPGDMTANQLLNAFIFTFSEYFFFAVLFVPCQVSHDFAINFNPEDDECEGTWAK